MAGMINAFSRRVVAPEFVPGTVLRQPNVFEEFSFSVLAVAIVPIPQDGDARWTYFSLQSGFLGHFSYGLDKRNNPLIPDLCKRLPRGLLDRIANISGKLHCPILGLSQFGIMVGGALGPTIGVSAPTFLEGAFLASARGFLGHRSDFQIKIAIGAVSPELVASINAPTFTGARPGS